MSHQMTPFKRSSSPSPSAMLDPPMKRLPTGYAKALGAFPSITSTEAISDVEDELAFAPRKDKGKGKAKLREMPELPESVWTRIFELVYEDITEEWHQSGQYQRALTPLLLSKDLTSTSLPVLYSHPVISYSTILPFLRCLPFASRYTDMAKVSHVRHLTIRASPAIPGLENKRLASAADSNTNRSNLHTIHASLPDVLRQFPELLTFTLKDTLVLYQADASILFNALKLIRPKKARLEIRMWDLYDCPVGQDLLAATRPSIHTSMSRTIISPPPSANREIRPFRDAGRSLMQEAWRDALYKGVELEFPQWWIEPPRADPPAPPANAAVGAHPFHQMHAAAMALLNAAPGNAPIDMSTFFSRHPSSSQTGLPGPAGGKTLSSTFNPYRHPPFQRRSTRPSSLPPGQASTTLDALTTRFVDDLSDVSSKADEDCARLLEATADQSGAFPDTLDLSTSSHATVSAPAPHTNTASPSRSMPLSAEMPLVSAEMPPVSAEMPPSGSSSVSTLAEPSSSQIVTGRSGQPCVNHVAMVIISADSPSSIAETVDMTEAQRARTDHLYVRPTTLSSNHSIDGHQRIPEIHSTVPPPRASTPSYLLRLRPDSRPSSRIRATRSSENRVVPAPDASAPGMTSYLLAHHTRGLLLELLEHHWTPYLQALSIVAFDPLVSLVVRAPLLDLWTQVAVPHIRVHLPRGCHSLAIFKGAKEVARDRMRNRQGDGAADPIPPDVNAENDQEADRVVGGDGMGGDLVHEDTRLFEIEVNTMAEMNDDVWIRGGNQLPPQVCRIFVGEQDWRDLRIGPTALSPEMPFQADHHISPSPSTSDFRSPTFTFGSSGSDGAMSEDEFTLEREAGDTYDAPAAAAQRKRIEKRAAGEQ